MLHILATQLFIACAFLGLACFVVVQIAMYRANRTLSLIAIASMGILTYVWGWFAWRSMFKFPVMTTWTVCVAYCLLNRL